MHYVPASHTSDDGLRTTRRYPESLARKRFLFVVQDAHPIWSSGWKILAASLHLLNSLVHKPNCLKQRQHCPELYTLRGNPSSPMLRCFVLMFWSWGCSDSTTATADLGGGGYTYWPMVDASASGAWKRKEQIRYANTAQAERASQPERTTYSIRAGRRNWSNKWKVDPWWKAWHKQWCYWYTFD
jgi:hypothetical protein